MWFLEESGDSGGGWRGGPRPELLFGCWAPIGLRCPPVWLSEPIGAMLSECLSVIRRTIHVSISRLGGWDGRRVLDMLFLVASLRPRAPSSFSRFATQPRPRGPTRFLRSEGSSKTRQYGGRHFLFLIPDKAFSTGPLTGQPAWTEIVKPIVFRR